jgi:glycosyltransferase involved in cell wall biosynthesis
MAWQPERDAFQPGVTPDPFEVYEQLARHGIDAVLIDPGRRPLNPFAGGATLLEALDPLRALRVLLRERRADIVISVFEGAALPLVLLRRLTAFRVPIVLWDLGLTEHWKLRERVLDLTVPQVDGIFVLSASQQPYIRARWGRQDGVEVIGQHIDTRFFAPTSPAPHGPVLAIGEDVGRDFATFLAAVEGVDADFLVKTRRIPPEEVLPPRVRVMRERVDYTALRDLYAQSRFVVIPLHPVPNPSGVSSILEASAMGRALVVSESDSIKDFIVPGETCLTVPCGDHLALRAAIQRLVDEPETCARLGANGRRFMEENFSNSVFADRVAKLLKRYARPRTVSVNKVPETR